MQYENSGEFLLFLFPHANKTNSTSGFDIILEQNTKLNRVEI